MTLHLHGGISKFIMNDRANLFFYRWIWLKIFRYRQVSFHKYNYNPIKLDISGVLLSSPIKQTHRQTNRDISFVYVLACEPSAAQDTKSYSAVYPHLIDFDGKLNLRCWSPLNLEISNQAKHIPVGLPNTLIKIWGK